MENLNYVDVMQDPMMWVMCTPAVLMAVVQAILISKKAMDSGKIVNLSREESMKAFKTGAVAAIGPAMSSMVVMITLMASVGGAFAWLRLCFIGSATTELTAASLGAQALGVELGGEGYDVTAYANSIWACTLNAFGWLFVAGVFTPKLADIKKKIAGDDPQMLNLISTSAMVGAFSYLSMGQCLAGPRNLAVFIFSGALMAILITVSNKYPKLKEHNLSIVLVCGLAFAAFLLSSGLLAPAAS